MKDRKKRKSSVFLRNIILSTIVLLFGIMAVIAAFYVNGYSTYELYMEEVINNEALAIRALMKNSNSKLGEKDSEIDRILTEIYSSSNKDDANIDYKHLLVRIGNEKVEKLHETSFNKNNKEELILTDQILLEFEKARIEKLTKTSIITGNQGKIILGTFVTFELDDEVYGVLFCADVYKDLFIFSGPSLIIFMLGVILFILSFITVGLPLFKTILKDRQKIYYLLDRLGSGIRILNENNDELLYSNQLCKDYLNEKINVKNTNDKDLIDGIWKYEEIQAQEEGDLKDVIVSKVFLEETNKWYRKYTSKINWESVKDSTLEVLLDITHSEKIMKEMQLNVGIIESLHDYVCVSDEAMNIIYANPWAYKLSGYSKKTLVSTSVLYTQKEIENINKLLSTPNLDNEEYRNNTIIRKKDGAFIDVEQTIFTMFDNTTKSNVIVTILHDITSQTALRREMLLQGEVIKRTNGFVTVINRDSNLIYANPRALALIGLDEAFKLTGQLPYKIEFLENYETINNRLNELSNNKPDTNVHHSFSGDISSYKKKNGEDILVSKQSFPLLDETGSPYAIATIAYDITEMTKNQKDLEIAKERLNIALEVSKAGVWEIDFVNNIVKYDKNSAGIFGVDSETDKTSLMKFTKMLRQNILDAQIQDSSEQTIDIKYVFINSIEDKNISDEGLSIDLSVKSLGGETKYITTYGKTFRDENNKLTTAIGFSMDMSQRHKMEKELQIAKELAESANVAKSLFLSNMSHEIRTPMNAIIGMTKMSLKLKDINKIYDNLNKVQLSSTHLLKIINDVLDLSKIEAGKLELFDEEFDLEMMLVDLMNLTSVKAEEKNQDIFIKIESYVPRNIIGDSVRLTQVLMNIISNSIKFTPDHGKIGISVNVKSKTDNSVFIEFIVSDNGIGMSPSQISKLFSNFQQADNSITKRFGGTGLGLAISKRIIETMNGAINVQSVMGMGSFFTITAEFKVNDFSQINNLTINMKGEKPLNILVVDDSKEILEYIKSIFETHKIKSKEVTNGYEAIEVFQESIDNKEYFDLIFMDYKMDGIDGLETSKRIKELNQNNYSKIVMMSMYELDKIEEEANLCGVDKFINKPIFPSVLINTINEMTSPDIVKIKKETTYKYNFANKTILIAEDIEINREIIESILEPTNVKIVMAYDGVDCVNKFEKAPNDYDLIFMDVQMPNLDGYSATRKIRSSSAENAKTIPIVAMTANAFKEDIDKAIASGMNGHLTKPVDEKKLNKELVRFFGAGVEIKEMPRLPEISAKNIDEQLISRFLDAESFILSMIDLKTGLIQLNYNYRLYTKLLTSFLSNSIVDELLIAIDNKQYDVIANKTHALKGISANLSLTSLLNIIVELEEGNKKLIKYEINSELIINLINVHENTKHIIQSIIDNPEIIEKYKK